MYIYTYLHIYTHIYIYTERHAHIPFFLATCNEIFVLASFLKLKEFNSHVLLE